MYTIQFLLTIADLKRAKIKDVEDDDKDADSEEDEESSDGDEVTDMDFASNWDESTAEKVA